MKKYLMILVPLLVFSVGYFFLIYVPSNRVDIEECTYEDYSGRCTITSISTYKTNPDEETIEGQDYDGYKVTYSFSLFDEADLEKIDIERGKDVAWGEDIALGKEQYLTYPNGFLLGDKFIEKYSLKEGNVYLCRLKITNDLTCEPAVVEFSGLNLKGYVDLR